MYILCMVFLFQWNNAKHASYGLHVGYVVLPHSSSWNNLLDFRPALLCNFHTILCNIVVHPFLISLYTLNFVYLLAYCLSVLFSSELEIKCMVFQDGVLFLWSVRMASCFYIIPTYDKVCRSYKYINVQ